MSEITKPKVKKVYYHYRCCYCGKDSGPLDFGVVKLLKMAKDNPQKQAEYLSQLALVRDKLMASQKEDHNEILTLLELFRTEFDASCPHCKKIQPWDYQLAGRYKKFSKIRLWTGVVLGSLFLLYWLITRASMKPNNDLLVFALVMLGAGIAVGYFWQREYEKKYSEYHKYKDDAAYDTYPQVVIEKEIVREAVEEKKAKGKGRKRK